MGKKTGKLSAFFYRHGNKGIPKLLLWVAAANVAVYLTYLLNPQNPLFYMLLCFSHTQIRYGEVWRLLTYPFVYLTTHALGGSFVDVLLGGIGLAFYYYLGSVLESVYGRLRTNLFYLSGVLLTALTALAIESLNTAYYLTYMFDWFVVDARFVNLTLLIAAAAIQPNAMVRIYFVIPLRMKWLAWIDFGYLLYGGIRLGVQTGFGALLWVLPIVAVLNVVLFFGSSLQELLPDFLRFHPKKQTRAQAASYREARRSDRPAAVPAYRFKCTVCGRTNVSDPGLEFRYCSRCAGYRCYCIDHINNHVHLTE